MSAHSRALQIYCEKSGCVHRAVEEVFNTYNARQGVYCKRHAAAHVKLLREGEKAMKP
jgi:hypothetical protein